MTKLAKVLVVFTTVMSLAFLAFIGVTALAGPNWQGTADQLDGYAFERTGGETPQWKVTESITGKDLGTKPNLPAAIAAAQDDRLRAQNERKTALDQEIALADEAIKVEKPASELDAAGVNNRFAQLRDTLQQLDARIAELTRQGTQQAQQAEALRTEAAARRDDVARLQNELAGLRTDRFRVEEQIDQLNQRLVRLRGQIDRATRRQAQFQAEAAGY